MTKKKKISEDFKTRDTLEEGVQTENGYSAAVKPTGVYAEFYKNCKDQDSKDAVLKAHDIAYVETLGQKFSDVDSRERYRENIFVQTLSDLGYDLSPTDNFGIVKAQAAFNLPLDLSTDFDYGDEKSYRRVRKKVNFISERSLKEIIEMLDEIVDNGDLIPLSIRNTASTSIDKDKIVLMTKQVYAFCFNLQSLLHRNDNRSFAVERLFEALVTDFESFYDTSSKDDIYSVTRLSALIIAEQSKAKQLLEDSYKELYHFAFDGDTKVKVPNLFSGKKLKVDVTKEPDEIQRLFNYKTEVATKFNDELFYYNFLEVA